MLCFVVETREKRLMNRSTAPAVSALTDKHWRHSEMHKNLKDGGDELKASSWLKFPVSQCFDVSKASQKLRHDQDAKPWECLGGNCWWILSFPNIWQLHCWTIFSLVKLNAPLIFAHWPAICADKCNSIPQLMMCACGLRGQTHTYWWNNMGIDMGSWEGGGEKIYGFVCSCPNFLIIYLFSKSRLTVYCITFVCFFFFSVIFIVPAQMPYWC